MARRSTACSGAARRRFSRKFDFLDVEPVVGREPVGPIGMLGEVLELLLGPVVSKRLLGLREALAVPFAACGDACGERSVGASVAAVEVDDACVLLGSRRFAGCLSGREIRRNQSAGQKVSSAGHKPGEKEAVYR